MAASNACSLSSENFKMPSEPCPLPSLGSDEESFVILWKDSRSPADEDQDPIGASVVEEAKQLINKELAQMEQSGLSQKSETSLQAGPSESREDQDNSKLERNVADSDKVQSATRMEQSTVLPKMPQVENGFDTSDVISITTLSTDMTSAEVQRKVSQIIEENIHLKDTILQNNMSLKSHYERIVAWQEDVQKVHQAHRQKLIEAKEFIEKLKREVHDRTQESQKLREIKKFQDEEIASLRNALKEKEKLSNEKLLKSSNDNIQQFELDVSNKKVRELELAMRNVTLENADLKEDLDKLKTDAGKIEQYERQIEMLQEALHVGKLQIEESKMELLKIKSLDDEKQRSMTEVIESLRSQLQYVEQQRAAVPSPEDVDNIRQQLLNTQITLTQVEHSRAAAYAQVGALTNEVAELRTQLERARLEAHAQVTALNNELSQARTLAESPTQKDEMYALQTQLEMYKADFEAERSAKDTLRAENEKLSEDMQNLHRRNQQLQEEIDLVRERDYVVYPPHRRSRESPSASSASSAAASNEHSMKCPKCNFGFTTMRALENHVYKCIELDDSLP